MLPLFLKGEFSFICIHCQRKVSMLLSHVKKILLKGEMHMNQKELLSLINEAMDLELNASHLYGLLGKLFPEDAEF